MVSLSNVQWYLRKYALHNTCNRRKYAYLPWSRPAKTAPDFSGRARQNAGHNSLRALQICRRPKNYALHFCRARQNFLGIFCRGQGKMLGIIPCVPCNLLRTCPCFRGMTALLLYLQKDLSFPWCIATCAPSRGWGRRSTKI